MLIFAIPTITIYMAEHNETGREGEEMAARFLAAKGITILEINWRFRKLEADIIGRTGNLLIVAEVKTRSSNFFGEPETFVTRKKQKNLIQAADAYIEKKGLDLEVRFDIISVVLNDESAVKHIEDAFSTVF
jgi:putative endonuclease